MPDFLSSEEIAKQWGVSARSVRNYCAQGRVEGAKLIGKSWLIPADAPKPSSANKTKQTVQQANNCLGRLRAEKAAKLKGGIYHKVQVDLTYNSNHIEGSKLSHDQTRLIFETATIGVSNTAVPVDDIVETANHFRAIDYIIDHAEDALTSQILKKLHYILKQSTNDASKEWFTVGDYKRLPNEVAGQKTTLPEDVANEIDQLLNAYNAKSTHGLEEIVAFHVAFERIHPFQDGNGRVGRLVMFKECLANNIPPFIILDEMKDYYYRGLRESQTEPGYLMDTCLAAQDQFKAALDYFRIDY